MIEPNYEAITAMSQNSFITNIDGIKYLISIIGGLLVIVNALVFYIVNSFKKSISDLWNKVNKDHDLIIEIHAEHKNFHKDDH